MKYIKIFAIVVIALWSCSQDDLNTYDAGRYIYFTQDLQKDSIVESFFFYPESRSIRVKLALSYAGKEIEEDRHYLLEVDEQMTTARPEEYAFDKEHVWKVGRNQDTVEIELKKTPALDTKHVRLVLKIVPSNDFNVGPSSNGKAILSYTSLVIAPIWWDATVSKVYLGAYSEEKYAAFMKATGIISMEGMEAGEMRYYSLKLKYELIRIKNETGKPVMDGNVEMTVPVLG